MKLQKSTLLALYSVLEFAAHPERQIPAAEIAGKYGVSTHHLSKVLRELGRAGLLDSVRGVGGGYRFSGNAKRVTLLDVIDLFEDIGGNAGEQGAASTDTERALAAVFSEIDQNARATFRSITLETLLKFAERERRAPLEAVVAGEPALTDP